MVELKEDFLPPVSCTAYYIPVETPAIPPIVVLVVLVRLLKSIVPLFFPYYIKKYLKDIRPYSKYSPVSKT